MSDWPDGYGRRILDTVDSTLNEAARLAPGLAGPEWIMARQQTAARGRRGRAWHMPPGNLACSLVLRLDEPPQRIALRSFVAALALFDACTEVLGSGGELSLKWPNDVLLNGGKFAGILLETLGGAGQGGTVLAIGIGANLAAAPEPAEVEARALRPVSVLGETGISLDPELFLTHLAACYARREAQFTTYGFDTIRQAWLAHAARLGDIIVARTGTAEIEGRFDTIDSDGNLVLVTSTGPVRIPAADVYF
jgi:BirA family biotin operon repressor/biotin-[acetyl-CoA-carboxylase] ligase